MSGSPWGGSEELWSRAALELARRGVMVAASVYHWPSPSQRVVELKEAGVKVLEHHVERGLVDRVKRNVFSRGRSPLVLDVERLLHTFSPALVVLSAGDVIPPIELMELCIRESTPFATIGHTNYEWW